MERKYYEAYDDRYRQVHGRNLRWSSGMPSPIVGQVIEAWLLPKTARILEIGCGEGRDGAWLMEQGYPVLATDISPAAVAYCRKAYPRYASRFAVLDCISQRMEARFDLIYAVAVVHMLVEDQDRDGFYRFLREQLAENGIALVCTMGDGTVERRTDPEEAFCLRQRYHESSGQYLDLAATSCRMVSSAAFREELGRNGLRILEEGLTAAEPDFPVMMYAVVERI